MAVHWLNQALCFYQSFCLVDSEVLRNRHLRVAASAINRTMIIEFGDKVKFVDNETTRKAQVAMKEGTCLGFTTPSVTNINYIGKTEIDYAISIELNDTKEIVWTTQDLVEFISHGEGQVIEIGNKRATRRADGSWKEEIIDPTKEKTSWLKRIFGNK